MKFSYNLQTIAHDETSGRISNGYHDVAPIPKVALYKTFVCGRSLAEISGSKLANGMDICFL